MNIKERLIEFLDYKGIKKATFEKEVGLSNGYIAKFKGNIGADKLENILRVYPELSRTWLLTGEGEMLKGEGVTQAADNETRPHLPVAVTAGHTGGISDAIKSGDCEQLPIIFSLPQYDATMTVQGDSMEPKFEGGDRIAMRKVKDYIEWGKTYVVDTDDGAVLKRIYDSGDSIRCVSYNESYPDFLIPKSSIYGLYKVVGLVRINQ